MISVTDEGRGVAPEQLPHLFRKHTTGGGQGARGEGSGLGLAISQQLVETMGGAIEVESEQNVGSIFTVRLPRTAPSSPKGQDDAEHGTA